MSLLDYPPGGAGMVEVPERQTRIERASPEWQRLANPPNEVDWASEAGKSVFQYTPAVIQPRRLGSTIR